MMGQGRIYTHGCQCLLMVMNKTISDHLTPVHLQIN